MFEKVAGSVQTLADILDRDTPVMPEVVEDRQKAGGVTLWTGDFEARDASLGECPSSPHRLSLLPPHPLSLLRWAAL